ncbi:MAG: LptA/OstA family protein [Pirellulaceae bacterium]
MRLLIPRYLMALVVTVCACGIYTSLVAPRIEGDPDIRRTTPTMPAPIRPAEDIKESLVGLFPEDGWEWQPCTILESRQARILFQDHNILEDGSVELMPLSMVLTPSAAPGQSKPPQPIVLRAPEGARLKFENGLAAGGDLGTLEHGQLLGEVQIYRPASDPAKDDALAVVTHNVQISPERIFTLYDCHFRFGQSYGHGRHLTVDLLGPGSQTEPGSVFSGVQRIKLSRLYELVLHQQPTESIETPEENDLLGDTRQSLKITSNGPMLFDFDAGTASFEDQVNVQSLADPGDQLNCDRLTIVLETPDEPNDDLQDKSKTPRYDIKRLVAEGTPATITSQSQQAQAIAERIDYDLAGNEVVMVSNEVVQLTRNGQQIQAREIRYEFSEDRRLGNATMLGPGWVRQPAEDGQGEFQCHWQNTLHLEEQNGKKVISLDRARVQMNDTALLANQLHLWLWEIPETGPDGKQRWRFQPAKMYADGQVKIESEQLKGDCSEAAAFWPAPGLHAEASLPHSYVVTRRVGAQQEQTQRNLSWQSAEPRTAQALQWQVPRTAVAQAGYQQPADSRSYTRFVGHQVQLQMRGGDDPGAIDEITVDGDVVIQQQQIDSVGMAETSLEIRGQKLRVVTRGENRHRLFVAGTPGQPAIVSAREIVLQGEAIHLDQTANSLWIEGPGQMQIDAQKQQQLQQPNASPGLHPGGSSAEPGLMPTGITNVDWMGGMVFDGQKIYFETAVHSQSRQTNERDRSTTTLATASAALELVLNSRIDFSNAGEDKVDDLKADRLVMVGWMESGDVAFPKTFSPANSRTVTVVSARYDAAGQLMGTQEMVAPRAEFDVPGGLANCRGPGYVMVRQPAGGTGSSDSGTPAMLASTGERSGNIDFVKVEFDDRFRGYMERRELHFTGNVHTFYTDTNDWQVEPPEHTIRNTGSRGMLLDCEELVLVQWAPQQSEPTVEMIATGNARVKGHQFDSAAERISYIQSTGIVTIEAPNRGNAELWFEEPGQSNRGHLIAKTITYNLATGGYEVQMMKQLDYSQQGRIRER